MPPASLHVRPLVAAFARAFCITSGLVVAAGTVLAWWSSDESAA